MCRTPASGEWPAGPSGYRRAGRTERGRHTAKRQEISIGGIRSSPTAMCPDGRWSLRIDRGIDGGEATDFLLHSREIPPAGALRHRIHAACGWRCPYQYPVLGQTRGRTHDRGNRTELDSQLTSVQWKSLLAGPARPPYKRRRRAGVAIIRAALPGNAFTAGSWQATLCPEKPAKPSG